MATAQSTLVLEDMLPVEGNVENDDQKDKEAARWVISPWELDTREREIGRRYIRAWLPTLIRTKSYERRADQYETDGAFFTVDRNYARGAATSLYTDYVQEGFRIIECMKGRDTPDDIRFMMHLMERVLPDPFKFDDGDSEWGLFDRRTAHLEFHRDQYEQGTLEWGVIDTILDANLGAQTWLDAEMSSLFAEARAKHDSAGSQPGRTKPSRTELRMFNWLSVEPSEFFAGTPARKPQEQVIKLPQELTDALLARATAPSAPSGEVAALVKANQKWERRFAKLEAMLSKLPDSPNVSIEALMSGDDEDTE